MVTPEYKIPECDIPYYEDNTLKYAINENKQNDCVDNLEWCSYEYNNTYKNIHLRRNQDNVCRMVIQYDLDMHEIKRWNSAAEAAKYYNIQAANIYACCTYRRNHCAGFKWRYFI